ncbi:MAG: glycosyltransferase [Pirellulales bacterium]|nr:glycosyltransferase [Pirellulales bacterium]
MRVHLLVLNYNGRDLLAECLPSVVRAARTSRHACDVTVIDNSSSDDSLALLQQSFPTVTVSCQPNLGLVSFNPVVAESNSDIVLLLNNDLRLREDALDPLVAPLLRRGRRRDTCFMTAPLCWRFDGKTYDGQKTAVRWRFGLVEATSLYEGHERTYRRPGVTASAGAALAVDRQKFLELGGFDPLYLPGRLEDLDFAYRGFQAGYEARYVPDSVMYHLGAATFSSVYGSQGCDRLALRNTLLFQWKNLRAPEHRARQVVGLAARLLRDAWRAPRAPRELRFATWRAWREAREIWSSRFAEDSLPHVDLARERAFFRRYHPRSIDRVAVERRPPALVPVPLERATA